MHKLYWNFHCTLSFITFHFDALFLENISLQCAWVRYKVAAVGRPCPPVREGNTWPMWTIPTQRRPTKKCTNLILQCSVPATGKPCPPMREGCLCKPYLPNADRLNTVLKIYLVKSVQWYYFKSNAWKTSLLWKLCLNDHVMLMSFMNKTITI